LTFDGDSVGSSTWKGVAKVLDWRYVAVEFYTYRTSDSAGGYWWFRLFTPAYGLLGSHPISGELARGPDTVSVWWGHIISGDPRTTGTLTVSRADSLEVDATFSYRGPVGVSGRNVFATIRGRFSATPYR
jgi:hypothetical protein